MPETNDVVTTAQSPTTVKNGPGLEETETVTPGNGSRQPSPAEVINQMREVSLGGLNRVLERAGKGKKLDRGDISEALTSTQQAVNGLYNLHLMFLRDMMSTLALVTQLEGALYQLGAQASTLAEVLKSKGLVTEEDAKVAWDNVVKPRWEAAAKQNKEQADVQSSNV